MILILGAWTFLRALFGSSAAVSLESVALINWPSRNDPWVALGFVAATASSGSGSRGCGPAGGPAFSSFGLRPSSPGTARVSSSTGAGSPDAAQWVALRATCNRQRAGASLGFRRSADFITVINALPECRGIQQ
jgi:hypothetical protein